MSFLLMAIAVIFIALSFFMLFAFYRTQHRGLVMMSFVYGASGMAAGYTMSWWPLLLGFLGVWMLKLAGFDPDTPRTPREGGEAPPGPPPAQGG